MDLGIYSSIVEYSCWFKKSTHLSIIRSFMTQYQSITPRNVATPISVSLGKLKFFVVN